MRSRSQGAKNLTAIEVCIADITGNAYYDMVLTQYSSVYYCVGTDDWRWLGSNATVIAAGDYDILAFAGKKDVVFVFASNPSGKFRQEKEMYFVGK